MFSCLLMTTACTPNRDDFGFRIEGLELEPGQRQITVRLDQQVRFSEAAERALRNGVTLTLLVDVEVRDARNLNLLTDQRERFEVRYLPLSERYQLAGGTPAMQQTYPRLRHVNAELSRLRLTLPTAPLAPGPYELRARMRLDRTSLPTPLQLPAVLSAEWAHDTRWFQWPFEIGA
jgi:hypothetical protein